MIEQLEFYHGAALIRLVEDPRCQGVSKNEFGYLVNNDRTVIVKYTTKARSPWRFTLTHDDIARFSLAATRFEICILALVCGGDGVCAVPWNASRELLGGKAGWLAAKRNFNGWYSLSGPLGTLQRKIALNQLPAIVFGPE